MTKVQQGAKLAAKADGEDKAQTHTEAWVRQGLAMSSP